MNGRRLAISIGFYSFLRSKIEGASLQIYSLARHVAPPTAFATSFWKRVSQIDGNCDDKFCYSKSSNILKKNISNILKLLPVRMKTHNKYWHLNLQLEWVLDKALHVQVHHGRFQHFASLWSNFRKPIFPILHGSKNIPCFLIGLQTNWDTWKHLRGLVAF